MNTLPVLRGELGVLRQEVAALAGRLGGRLEVEGGDGTSTVVDGGMIDTGELRCDRAHVLSLRVHGLEVVGDAPVLGPTGCRGPPGYATNTGATGPAGGPCVCLPFCRLVRGGPLVERNGVWCHELGDAVFSTRLRRGGKIRVVLGVVGGGFALNVQLLLLTPSGAAVATERGADLPYSDGDYQEACLEPVDVPPGGALIQATVSSPTSAYLAHLSIAWW